MEGINSGFYFVADILVNLQFYFTVVAWKLGGVVFLISLLLMGLKYAMTGQGLKENVVKLTLAVPFFVAVIFGYPKIVNWITRTTYEWAAGSTYEELKPLLDATKAQMADDSLNAAAANSGPGTYGNQAMMSPKSSEVQDPGGFFKGFVITRKITGKYEDNNGFLPQSATIEYSTVAPAEVLKAVLIVAGGCFQYADNARIGNFGQSLKGILCALMVIFVGAFGVLEYVIAFLEFMFVSSVGIILFPGMLWEGSKFLSEKFVGALIGFFIKLLICNICMFLMLYGFLKMAAGFNKAPFTGLPDEIVALVFTSFLFFFICKSAPALAQSLLTGTPSLSGAGAIAAAGTAAAAAGLAGGAAAKVGGLAAKGGFNVAGAGVQALGAMGAAKEAGGGAGTQARAALKSLGSSATQGMKAMGHDLSRSLLGGKEGGGGGAGGGAKNTHSNRQQFLAGEKGGGTMKGYFAERKSEGAAIGRASMAGGNGQAAPAGGAGGPEPGGGGPAGAQAPTPGKIDPNRSSNGEDPVKAAIQASWLKST